MRHFMHAKEYVVVGKILTDPERFDHKVSLAVPLSASFADGSRCSSGTSIAATVWLWLIVNRYQARDLPVTPIKATAAENEQVEGLIAISDPVSLVFP
jgi:hypothetical protein